MSMFTWSIHYKFILSDWHIFCIDRLVSVIPWSWDSCSQVSCHSRRHLAATIATVQCKLATGLPGLPDGRIQRFFFAKGESNGKHVSLFSVNAWAKGMVSIPSRIIGGHWWGSTSRSHRQWLQMFSSWKFWCFALDSLQPTGDEEAARRKLKEKAGEIQGDDTARLLRHLAWQGLARRGMQITSKSSCNNFWSRSTTDLQAAMKLLMVHRRPCNITRLVEYEVARFARTCWIWSISSLCWRDVKQHEHYTTIWSKQ